MVAAPRATGIGEDQDALRIIHEGLGFAEVRGGGTVLDLELPLARFHDAPLASGDLRDHIPAEMPKDLIERALHRGQRPKMLDKIAQGKLKRFFKDNTLVNQDFIKDSKVSVSKYVKSIGDVEITGFKRVALG